MATGRNKKNGNVTDRRISGRIDSWTANFIGALCEEAVDCVTGCGIDRTFIQTGGDKHSPDIQIGKYSVELKAAMYDPPILKITTLEDYTCDCFLLALVDHNKPHIVYLCGVIGYRDFDKLRRRHNFGWGPCWIVDEEEMKDVRPLIDHAHEQWWEEYDKQT